MVSHKDYSAEISQAYPDRGHPIADPQPGFIPNTKNFLPRVDLGDVGYIQHNHGRFVRLFNVHKRPGVDGQPSRSKLPVGFEVLERDDVPIHEGELNKKLFKSESVSLKSINGGVSGSGFVPLQGTFNFKKTRQSGAILVTPGPERITTIDASPKGVKIYKLYAAKHLPSWLDFFEDEGLDRGDLIFVTGVDLVVSWATAAFASSSTEAGLGLDIQYVTIGGVQAAVKFSWDHDEAAMSNSTPLTQDGPNTIANQTIFIRRLRAKRRGFLGVTMRANAEPRDPDFGDDSDDDSDDDVALEMVESPARGEFTDALTPIMDYVLQHSNAEFALVHDEDISMYDRFLVRGLQDGLNITVTENGIGILNLESSLPQGPARSPVAISGRQVVAAQNETDQLAFRRAQLQRLMSHHSEAGEISSSSLRGDRIPSPHTGTAVVLRPPRAGHEAPHYQNHDRQSSSAMIASTAPPRRDQSAPQIPAATQHPAWLQRAIDCGYRLDAMADRREAVPPLLSNDGNRSWTLHAQNAGYMIDTRRMIIFPPGPQHQRQPGHDDMHSTTPEAGSVSAPRRGSGLGMVPQSRISAPAPRRGILKRIFSASYPQPPTSRIPNVLTPESQAMDYALNWQLLPYNAQSGHPRMYFDMRFAAEYASHVRDGQGHFNIPRTELEMLATREGLPFMTFTAWDLPVFDIEVQRPEGVRVCDVLEHIYENYQLVLTRTERALHRDRVERSQPHYEGRVRRERQRNPAYVDQGMRRIDLMEGKVIFIGCQWREPCQEYPDGAWTLLFLPPPRHASAEAAEAPADVAPTLAIA